MSAAVAAGKIALEYTGFLILGQEDRRRPLNHLLFPAAVLAKDLLFFAEYSAPFQPSGGLARRRDGDRPGYLIRIAGQPERDGL